jgi:hypothetical protein
MQDFTENSASSISLGSCQEYYRDLPDQFHLDLLGESSTSFTSTTATESGNNNTDNNNSTRQLKFAAPNTVLPLTSTPPRLARSFKEFEHSTTLTPVTLALTFAESSSSLDDIDNYNELPVPPLNASHSLTSSCPPEQLQVQSVVTVPVPLEVEETDCGQCRIQGKLCNVPAMRLPFVVR